jgi:hypothetical protein
MVINDTRAPSAYSMDVTRTVDAATSMGAIVDMILAAARTARGEYSRTSMAPTAHGGILRNLILFGHGRPGSLGLGVGLVAGTMAEFARIQGRVHKIWFRGCLTARTIDSQTARQGDGAALQTVCITSGNGHDFCKAFAKLTHSYVVAPTEMQACHLSHYPHGVMDSYEGLVLCYDPHGEISWQRRYPSLYGHDMQARTAHNPNQE